MIKDIYVYNEPGPETDPTPRQVRKTEAEILAEYGPEWFRRMIIAERPDEEITRGQCIKDWCIIHWAWKEKAPACGPDMHDGFCSAWERK